MHKLRWIGTALALALAWMPARADIDIFIKPVLTLEVVQRIGGAAMTAVDQRGGTSRDHDSRR